MNNTHLICLLSLIITISSTFASNQSGSTFDISELIVLTESSSEAGTETRLNDTGNILSETKEKQENNLEKNATLSKEMHTLGKVGLPLLLAGAIVTPIGAAFYNTNKSDLESIEREMDNLNEDDFLYQEEYNRLQSQKELKEEWKQLGILGCGAGIAMACAGLVLTAIGSSKQSKHNKIKPKHQKRIKTIFLYCSGLNSITIQFEF